MYVVPPLRLPLKVFIHSIISPHADSSILPPFLHRLISNILPPLADSSLSFLLLYLILENLDLHMSFHTSFPSASLPSSVWSLPLFHDLFIPLSIHHSSISIIHYARPHFLYLCLSFCLSSALPLSSSGFSVYYLFLPLHAFINSPFLHLFSH